MNTSASEQQGLQQEEGKTQGTKAVGQVQSECDHESLQLPEGQNVQWEDVQAENRRNV